MRFLKTESLEDEIKSLGGNKNVEATLSEIITVTKKITKYNFFSTKIFLTKQTLFLGSLKI